ncbi:MAG: acyl-CoA dehydrogenase [Rhodospirillaceae bacterium]|nr:acyl-CoA dehydrogenase [Rhodospirillaceae bacterium]|tara:strand:- start:470 stop:1654 length:1185 start_codon:yes stop_codon:yes gene_type:complete
MDQIVTNTNDIDWVERACGLQDMIAGAADETEAQGKVTAEVMEALHDAELFRMALPRSIGGGEADPLTLMQTVEAVAKADASTAWCVGQGTGCTWGSGYVSHEVCKDIFGPRDAVLAWGPPAKATAVPVDGGYRVTGEWRFGSGSRNATWLGGHSRVCDEEGNHLKDDDGKPIMRTMLFPKSSAELIDVWQVIGLKGTGSDNYKVEDLFVPEEYTTWRDSQPDRVEPGPLYNIPLLTGYGIMFSGLALGIARTMMEDFKELAVTKVGGGMTTVLRENAVIQSQVSINEAKLRSSRAFLVEMIEEYWEAQCSGEPPSYDVRARLRLAITYAMNQAQEAANFVFQACGTNAIFEVNPFERRFRDIHTVLAQGQSHVSNYEPVGQVLMGLPPSGHRV